ncbi:hypothetical protein SDC9_210594 [bioreactor metagenome]|uniref:Uncharacterized protein n=1 Tax=bioreactor metagenome TaxID=1076179 RepID=A0A645JGV2_9ZZZZ
MPPTPIPAYEGPFLTNIVVWMSLAIFVRLSTFRECIIAVWRLPCSTRTAISIASLTSPARTTGSIGIISSACTKGCSSFASMMITRVSLGAATPALSRMYFALLPTNSVFGDFLSRMTRSTRRSMTSGSLTSKAPFFFMLKMR